MADLLRITRNHVFDISQMLKRAFFKDPMLEYFYPEEIERNDRGHLPFRFTLDLIISYGISYSISENLEAVILYTKSDSPFFSLCSQLRHRMITTMFAMGMRGSLRGLRYDTISRNLHAKLVPQPHIYLSTLGVDPPHQKQGKSHPLMRKIINEADEQHLPIYLETTYRGNVDYYRQFGFTVLDEIKISSDGFYLWPMFLDLN